MGRPSRPLPPTNGSALNRPTGKSSGATTGRKPTPAEQVYTFTPGATFAVTVSVNWPLDLMLERGEQVRNIVGGDRAPAEANQTARWEVKEGADGIGDMLRQHVFLTAAAPNLTTGLIVTTTRRTYYLTYKSVKTSPIRVVRWQYTHDPAAKRTPAKTPGLLPDPAQPMYYHVGYELTSSQPPPSWNPRQVVTCIALVGGTIWLLMTKARPFAIPNIDSTAWPAWMRQA
jgi:type IV secretory pathway VirB9-like protein